MKLLLEKGKLTGKSDDEFIQKQYNRSGSSGKRLGCKNYKRICESCGTNWYASSGGAGKRKLDLCDKCYPIHRQADILYGVAKNRSDKNGYKFNLTPEFILAKLKGVCPRTNLPFVIGIGSNYSDRHPQTPSIDKINPSKGYTQDNVQIVCWWYNCAKQRYTDEEVLNLCKAVVVSSNM